VYFLQGESVVVLRVSLQWGGGDVFFGSLCRNIHLLGHKYVPTNMNEWPAKENMSLFAVPFPCILYIMGW